MADGFIASDDASLIKNIGGSVKVDIPYSTEGLGFEGQSKGISAQAIALVKLQWFVNIWS